MNAIVIYMQSKLADVRTRASVLNRLAGDAAKGEVSSWERHHAIQYIFNAYRAVADTPNYHVSPTLVALFLAIGCIGGAWIVMSEFEGWRWSWYVAAFMLVAGSIATYWAVARKHGAEFITPERWQTAQRRLSNSGDLDAHPLRLLLRLVLLGILAIDGALSGAALIRFFEGYFTARGAMLASVGWGLSLTALLWHACSAAAREAEIGRRRRMCAGLLDSPLAAQRKQGEAMLERLGPVIGVDVHRPYQAIMCRVSLALLVVALGVGTLLMRIHAVEETPSEQLRPAALVKTADTGADPEGAVPPQSRSNEGQLLGSAVLSLFFCASVLAAYYVRRREVMLATESETDHEVLGRFQSEDELISWHVRQFRHIAARADRRFAQFAAAMERERAMLPREHRNRWPAVEVSFTQLWANAPRAAEPQMLASRHQEAQ